MGALDMRQHLVAAAVAAALGLVAQSAFADESTSIGGKLFADFSNISQDKNGHTTDADGTGIDVKRFYFVVDHKFDDIWSADLTTDFNYVSNDGETQLFVKKAYVQAKLDEMFTARLGSADMPWIPFVEGWYGYRYVENTLIDRLKYGNSADWGIHALSGTKGMFNYAVSVVNGGGYKNPSRSSGMDWEGRVGFQPIDGLVVAGGFYSGDRGKDVESAPTTHTATRWDALLAYKGGPFRAGLEYFSADNWNNVTTTAKDSADGWSIYGSWAFTPEWGVFARYDRAKLSKDLDPTNKDTYYNAGVEWNVRKGISISGVWKHEIAKSSPLNSDGVPTYQKIKTDEIGIFTQVAF
jgi:Gram-negative porin